MEKSNQRKESTIKTNNNHPKILVYRLSARGDVAMLLPVLKGLVQKDDYTEIYLLTQPSFFCFFTDVPHLHLIAAEIKGKHRKLKNLIQLFFEIKRKINPDKVIDVHGVLRTYILDLLFTLSGFKVILFKKERGKKEQIIKTKKIHQLTTTTDRYANAFRKAGLSVILPKPPLLPTVPLSDKAKRLIQENKHLIGIAPFAGHPQKEWGIEKIEKLISRLCKENSVMVVLLGGGKKELTIMREIANHYTNCIVSADHFNSPEDFTLFKHFDTMFCMDSSNMHISAMSGIPTLAIWGPTHPKLGFAPYMQPYDNILQCPSEKLSCRPCSSFGKKKCIYPSQKCMDYITVDMVYDRIKGIMDKKEENI